MKQVLGAKLRELRKERSLTLQELGRRTRLSFSLISDIEHNRANPSIKSLKRLCDVLNVKPEIFLNEINENGGDPNAQKAPQV